MQDADVMVTQSEQRLATSSRLVLWFVSHWLAVFNIAWGIFVILPWLAPVLMHVGATGPARGIYATYSLVCHQLPERSYFLFGDKPTYSLVEINRVWPGDDAWTLRQFTGTSAMGYKVAYSDRMVSMYTGMWIGSLLFALVRRKVKPLSLWGYALLIAPMGLDGTTHFISDLAGIGQGFRDSNEWLAVLTNRVFPAWFYAGDALGSFNSWMRLFTGLLFGLATVWLVMPYLEESFASIREDLERRVASV